VILPLTWIVPAVVLIAQQPVEGPHMDAQPPPAAALADAIGCAPISVTAPPAPVLRVSGGYVHGRIMFGPRDPLIVNAGSRQGLQKGQRYFVRRYVNDMFTPASLDFTPYSVHTAGWVTIVDVKDDLSVAEVTHACDGIVDGDYLEPYTEPLVPPATPAGEPDYEHPARIVMGDEKRQTAAPGMLMLINRGSDHGLRAGQALTIFRDTLQGAGPAMTVGEGTILSVRPQTALIRIDASHDAVYVGDMAAIHRLP
jgi:hypothetical protein